MTENELITDDEILREDGMADGPCKIGQIDFRPMTALSFSWIQRNGIFADGYGDSIKIAAAYAYLHSAKISDIRAVVNNRDKFDDAVDLWIEENISFHTELEPLTDLMNSAINSYMAASTRAANPSNKPASGLKN
jgi:hypothetical protein